MFELSAEGVIEGTLTFKDSGEAAEGVRLSEFKQFRKGTGS